MALQGIVPITIALTEGDFHTLWAPKWREHGQEWQAFLGNGDDVYLFRSTGELLAFIESDARHDLRDHPKWQAFQHEDAARVVPDKRGYCDVIGVPELLAGRPSHENVTGVERALAVARSLGDVIDSTTVGSFFSSYSVLANVARGADHYAVENGGSEWSAVGRAVLSNWDRVVDELDGCYIIPEQDTATVDAAQTKVDAAVEAREQARIEEERAAEAAEAQVDPYDASLWGTAGIDPVKIAVEGRTLYTLRTYVDGQPVFLGHFGQIYTFNNRRAMLRWLAEHDEHDLASTSTWSEIMDGVNGGTLEVTAHPDNTYVFTGLVEDITDGPNKVDTGQLRQAYELLADAADWARDDAVNSVLVANPALQEYIAYMLGGSSGYSPSAPYTAEAEGWRQLENGLVGRFSRF
ncbi:hypothetical protein [Corynebacterium pygosceleis]|uniref:Primosomal protein n=1 Tax=Corynebacterium pygosceleis TaxID=2800406 RepID=A0A9Q4GI38_9CORY|nr:hypothetical protein [Corynebacterium pygosceleis]MCK7637653.1 hypothetical protein [Corynebacterium pygosceleis]MCK7674844.1 hypothetical protein [Corynebacterium pygosceleis]MCL0119567.1 hypothetical protein [Corynebacterium pygosceleis]MCX7444808.1 hypothetical protein [Corynebacterium pygosceleis]MCX7468018.1 hypothetical protein [Corynebacterium pygosceleis]